MNTDDEVEQAIENIQANFGFGRIANKKIVALLATERQRWEISAQLRILKHFGFPKELTKKGLDDIWQLTNELEATIDGELGKEQADV